MQLGCGLPQGVTMGNRIEVPRSPAADHNYLDLSDGQSATTLVLALWV